MANEQAIWDFLKAKGFNDFATAGLMGNLKAESALNPMNLQNSYEKKLGMTDEEYVKKVDNGTYKNFSSDAAGFGLAQWTSGGRKKNLYNFIKEKSKSIGDLNCQLEFLYKELSESYKTVFNTLKTATSVREASDVVLLKFEIPANRGEEVQKLRASYGQKFYDQYANTTKPTTGGAKMDYSKYTKYIYSTGTHYISNSGSDERKKYTGGTAGDQTGHEWELKAWYNRPWSVVLRYEADPRVGILMANLSCAAAQNDKIGYDQAQRTTYWTQLQKVNYDPSKITTACEEDCTAGVTSNTKACGYLLGIESLQKLSTSIYSKTMKSNFVKAGFKALTESKYLTSTKYLLPGDVLLYEGHHAAANVTVGSAVKATYKAPDISNIKFDGVTPAPAPAPAPVITPEPTPAPVVITVSGDPIGTAIAKQDMHIRNASNTTGESVGIVKKGSILEVYELLDNGWMKVKSKDVVGYTSNRNNAYYDFSEKKEPAKAKVNCGKLNVRKGPSKSYGVQRIITLNTEVTIYEEKDSFGKISKTSEEWCVLKYLTKI